MNHQIRNLRQLLLPPAACWTTLVVLLLVVSRGALADDPVIAGAETNVTLTIDFGNGFRKTYDSIPVSEGMTVADAMQFAANHDQPTRFGTRGRKQTAFLESIDGVENEGYGKRSWIFHINGKKAEESYGTAKVQPGDTTLWRFQQFP